ncbi:MAG: mitochondrial fission ELM1 family protein [Candidatus Omnitrophica bacterium]|nr:mitochondrial fission ELM1 family protein [Candidatus Omnitrophota bacterium]
MRKNFSSEYILYLIVKLLAAFFRFLPVDLSLAIGRKLGILGLYLNNKRRCIAYANLKSAFGNKYDPYKLSRILKRTYVNIGQAIIEVLLLPKIDKKYTEENFTYEGFEKVDRALKKGKGVILLTGHFGSWENANVALALKGYTYTAIAREQKPFLINRLLNTYRQCHGCRVISKGMPIRDIIKALRNNEIVGMLVDQDAGKNGIFADLFNKPASWHRGVMEFALSTGCEVIPGFGIRQGGKKIKFMVCDPIKFPDAGTDEEKIKSGFAQFAARLEDIISRYPDQWLWQHKRWKSSPQKKILILNDSRAGHLRQSQAVLSQIEKIYEDKGIAKDNIITETIDVTFRNKFSKSALHLAGCFQGRHCHGCMRCLKFALREPCYRKLSRVYADIIISCGSKTYPVNLLLSGECNAKSIAIMNPGRFLADKFNLVIMPRHDGLKRSKNITITEGAVNVIGAQMAQYQAESLKQETGKLSEFRIGLLLGGDYKKFRMQEAMVSTVIKQIKDISGSINADILATTSRRTPKNIERLLKTELAPASGCRFLIIANENNKEGVVGGILGLSSVVIVSPESVSMVSEAASSAGHVIVFNSPGMLDKKHYLFLKNLSDKGYIRLVGPEQIADSIKEFFKGKQRTKILDDNTALKKGLEKII